MSEQVPPAPLSRRIQHDDGPPYVYRGRLIWGPGGDVSTWRCEWCGALTDDHRLHTNWHKQRP